MTGRGEVTRRQEVITSYWLVIATVWDWEPTVVLGCFALLVDYCFAAGFRLTRRMFYFVLGDLVLLFALVSPWDTLGDSYLFSGHMLQHLLLVLVVPPLFLLAIPPPLWTRARRWSLCRRLEDVFSQPMVA